MANNGEGVGGWYDQAKILLTEFKDLKDAGDAEDHLSLNLFYTSFPAPAVLHHPFNDVDSQEQVLDADKIEPDEEYFPHYARFCDFESEAYYLSRDKKKSPFLARCKAHSAAFLNSAFSKNSTKKYAELLNKLKEFEKAVYSGNKKDALKIQNELVKYIVGTNKPPAAPVPPQFNPDEYEVDFNASIVLSKLIQVQSRIAYQFGTKYNLTNVVNQFRDNLFAKANRHHLKDVYTLRLNKVVDISYQLQAKEIAIYTPGRWGRFVRWFKSVFVTENWFKNKSENQNKWKVVADMHRNILLPLNVEQGVGPTEAIYNTVKCVINKNADAQPEEGTFEEDITKTVETYYDAIKLDEPHVQAVPAAAQPALPKVLTPAQLQVINAHIKSSLKPFKEKSGTPLLETISSLQQSGTERSAVHYPAWPVTNLVTGNNDKFEDSATHIDLRDDLKTRAQKLANLVRIILQSGNRELINSCTEVVAKQFILPGLFALHDLLRVNFEHKYVMPPVDFIGLPFYKEFMSTLFASKLEIEDAPEQVNNASDEQVKFWKKLSALNTTVFNKYNFDPENTTNEIISADSVQVKNDISTAISAVEQQIWFGLGHRPGPEILIGKTHTDMIQVEDHQSYTDRSQLVSKFYESIADLRRLIRREALTIEEEKSGVLTYNGTYGLRDEGKLSTAKDNAKKVLINLLKQLEDTQKYPTIMDIFQADEKVFSKHVKMFAVLNRIADDCMTSVANLQADQYFNRKNRLNMQIYICIKNMITESWKLPLESEESPASPMANAPASPQPLKKPTTFGRIVEFCMNVTRTGSPSSRPSVGQKKISPDGAGSTKNLQSLLARGGSGSILAATPTRTAAAPSVDAGSLATPPQPNSSPLPVPRGGNN